MADSNRRRLVAGRRNLPWPFARKPTYLVTDEPFLSIDCRDVE
jgi:hypothetical protein